MSDTFERGVTFYQEGLYRKALAQFDVCDDDPAENTLLSYYLGLCHTKLENYEKALLFLEQVVTSHDNIIHIYQSRLILSYIYSITGRLRLAEFEIKKLLEAGYESPQVYSAAGYVYYELGKTEDSLEFLLKALNIEPDNSNALNSVGYIMAEEDLDIPSALSYCRRAVDLSPENPSYLDSLGWACFKAGDLMEAKQHLTKAFTLAEGHRTISGHLRDLLERERL
ncbi:MAG: tetratricopeptide repeat protein [Spirochaetales bacterium]|nr:tetratricopeptide repeat protein [Spirochaetales bacterium]